MIEITDFVPHAPVPTEIVEEYRGRVPDELIEVWERYGYGTFAEGFIRVIDPKRYEEKVGHCIGKTQGDGIAIPIMVTGLGDLITWEPSQQAFIGILYRLADTVGITSKLPWLLRLVEDEMLLERLKADIFPEAVAALGELPFDESFIFVPLLSMAGEAKVENLKKRDTIAAIQVAVDLQGVIGH